MDTYHAYFDLKVHESDLGFAKDLRDFLDYLVNKKKIESRRLMRRKLGLGPRELGEFHLMIEVSGLAQLDEAFNLASTQSSDMEDRHARVNQKIADITFALYRDFPDPHREKGREKF